MKYNQKSMVVQDFCIIIILLLFFIDETARYVVYIMSRSSQYITYCRCPSSIHHYCLVVFPIYYVYTFFSTCSQPISFLTAPSRRAYIPLPMLQTTHRHTTGPSVYSQNTVGSGGGGGGVHKNRIIHRTMTAYEYVLAYRIPAAAGRRDTGAGNRTEGIPRADSKSGTVGKRSRTYATRAAANGPPLHHGREIGVRSQRGCGARYTRPVTPIGPTTFPSSAAPSSPYLALARSLPPPQSTNNIKCVLLFTHMHTCGRLIVNARAHVTVYCVITFFHIFNIPHFVVAV